jgi:hypothetical protein
MYVAILISFLVLVTTTTSSAHCPPDYINPGLKEGNQSSFPL